jgi:uncharacterized membrane protein
VAAFTAQLQLRLQAIGVHCGSIRQTKTESELSLAFKTTPPEQPPAPPIDGMLPNIPDQAAKPRWPQRFQLAAVVALIIGYAALSHYSASSPDNKGLGAALSIGPVLLIGVVLLWRWTQPLAALLIAASLCAFLYGYWPVIERNYEWADLAQQCGAYGLVALSFARSLFAGRVPMCTQVAIKLYAVLTPAEMAYTRRATVAWVMFYVLMTMAILILFFVASLRVWSLFVNFVTFGLIILMSLADHAIRRRVLPRRAGGGILAIIGRSLTG